MKDVNRQEFIASLRRSVPSLLHFDCRDRFSSSFPFSGRAPVSPGGPLLTGELRGAALGFLFIYLFIIFYCGAMMLLVIAVRNIYLFTLFYD